MSTLIASDFPLPPILPSEASNGGIGTPAFPPPLAAPAGTAAAPDADVAANADSVAGDAASPPPPADRAGAHGERADAHGAQGDRSHSGVPKTEFNAWVLAQQRQNKPSAGQGGVGGGRGAGGAIEEEGEEENPFGDIEEGSADDDVPQPMLRSETFLVREESNGHLYNASVAPHLSARPAACFSEEAARPATCFSEEAADATPSTGPARIAPWESPPLFVRIHSEGLPPPTPLVVPTTTTTTPSADRPPPPPPPPSAPPPSLPPMTESEYEAYRILFASVAGPAGTASRAAAQPIFDKASTAPHDVDAIWGMLVRARRRRRRRRRAAMALGQATGAANPPTSCGSSSTTAGSPSLGPLPGAPSPSSLSLSAPPSLTRLDSYGDATSSTELSETEFAIALHLAAALYRGLLPKGFPPELPEASLLPHGLHPLSPHTSLDVTVWEGAQPPRSLYPTSAAAAAAPPLLDRTDSSTPPAATAALTRARRSPRAPSGDAPPFPVSSSTPAQQAPPTSKPPPHPVAQPSTRATARINSRRVAPMNSVPVDGAAVAVSGGRGAAARTAAAEHLSETVHNAGLGEEVYGGRGDRSPTSPLDGGTPASRQLASILTSMRDRKATRAAVAPHPGRPAVSPAAPPSPATAQNAEDDCRRFAPTFGTPPAYAGTVMSAPASKLPSPSSSARAPGGDRSQTAALLDAANRAASAYHTLSASRGRIRDDRAAVIALLQRAKSSSSVGDTQNTAGGGQAWALARAAHLPESSPSAAVTASRHLGAAVTKLDLRLIQDHEASAPAAPLSAPPLAYSNSFYSPFASPGSGHPSNHPSGHPSALPSARGSCLNSPDGAPLPSPHSPRRLAVFYAAQQMAVRTAPASVTPFSPPADYPTAATEALREVLPALQAGTLLIKWQPTTGGLPPAPFFFWVEPAPAVTPASRSSITSLGGALGGMLPSMPPYASDPAARPVPVLAWRDPAAARGGAPLASLSTQRVPLCALTRAAPPGGAALEQLRAWAKEGRLGQDVADLALTECALLLWWDKPPQAAPLPPPAESPASPESSVRESIVALPAPSSGTPGLGSGLGSDPCMLLFAPDPPTRDAWAHALNLAMDAARALDAPAAAERTSERVGERLARARQAGRTNRRQQASQPVSPPQSLSPPPARSPPLQGGPVAQMA
jgi:hypothetical protein